MHRAGNSTDGFKCHFCVCAATSSWHGGHLNPKENALEENKIPHGTALRGERNANVQSAIAIITTEENKSN